MADEYNFDQAAYDNLNWQIDDTRGQIFNYEHDNTILDAQISRLNAVKRDLTAAKSEFKYVNVGTKSAVSDEYEWKGETYRYFSLKGECLTSEVIAYYDYIDRVLDLINDKITELSNRRYSNLGIISDLYAWVNNLRNEIENLFN